VVQNLIEIKFKKFTLFLKFKKTLKIELADQEEYAFNATFKSQLSSDNMVSFPNLTQIGTDETYNIKNMESTVNATMLNTTTRANNVKSNLDITFLVDGSDSFNESVSKTEDGFQERYKSKTFFLRFEQVKNKIFLLNTIFLT
jgi:hypothetical protein